MTAHYVTVLTVDGHLFAGQQIIVGEYKQTAVVTLPFKKLYPAGKVSFKAVFFKVL